MRILLADVNVKVAALLAEIKEGVETARAAGLIVELPEKVDFSMDIVTAAQSLTSSTSNSTDTSVSEGDQTTTRNEGAQTNTRNEGAQSNSRSEGAGTNTRTEGANTNTRTVGPGVTTTVDSETNTQNTAQNSYESGGDSTTRDYIYEGT